MIIFDHKPYWYEVQYDNSDTEDAYTGWAPKCFFKEQPDYNHLPFESFKFQDNDNTTVVLREVEIQDRIDMLDNIEAKLDKIYDEDLSNFPAQGQMRVSYDEWLQWKFMCKR